MRNQNEIVYCIEGEKIEKYTWGEFCIAYGSDETTTPNGVAPRCFILEDKTGDGLTPIELRKWGLGGSGPSTLIDTYDTMEEAQQALLEIFEYNTLQSDQTPPFYYSVEDAHNAFLEE